MAVNLDDLFRGVGQRMTQAIPAWQSLLASPQPQGGNAFNMLPQAAPAGNAWGQLISSHTAGNAWDMLPAGGRSPDAWAMLGGGGGRSGNVWDSMGGYGQTSRGDLVGQALNTISQARNVNTPTPNTGAFTANMAASLTPDQQTWWDKAKKAGEAHGLDGDIFARQMFQESGFNDDVITGRRTSSKGAQGIAQFMPDTARGLHINPLDPDQALEGAARYTADLLHTYGGDYQMALVAYNGGAGAVKAWQAGTPYTESKNYIASILNPSAPAAAPAQTGNAGADAILAKVQPYMDTPYQWGGGGRPDAKGGYFDCSGLVGYLLGVPHPETHPENTVTLWHKSTAVDPSQAQPGDMVFWNMDTPDMTVQHVAMYMGNNQIIESGGDKHSVHISTVDQKIGTLSGFRRFNG